LDQRPINLGSGLIAVEIILGPVLMREGGYAFDAWTPEDGLRRGYVYPRIEDAYYARRAELRCLGEREALPIVACNTVDEFARATTVLIHPDAIVEAERRLALRRAGVVETTARLGSRQAA
jgi:hypothetical protein